MVIVQGQGDLLAVIQALGAGRGFPDLLNCRQKQSDQNGNDGDDHQEFDERERPVHAIEELHQLYPRTSIIVGAQVEAGGR